MRAVSRGALASVFWHCSMQSGCTAVHEGKQCLFPCDVTMKSTSSFIQINSCNLPYAFCEQIGKEIRDISDEIPFEIPDSWEWVHLDNIAISDLGKTLDKAKNTGNFQPYLCSINVYWNGIDLSKVKEARFEDSELPKYLLKKGDLLICEGGEVGRCCVWDKDIPMYYQNALHRVRFYGNINPHYFKCLMELYKGIGIIEAHSKGVTIKHLVQKALNSIYFPLSPLSEQHRIVSKIEELLPYIERYGKAEEHLTALNTTFPEMLKKSILQEAVQGKLVPQNPDDEPASVLLERIRAEKQKLIKAGKIKKSKHESVIITRDKIPYEIIDGKERCIADEVPFELPESWEWAYIGNIAFVTKLAGFEYTKNIAPNLQSSGIPLFKGKNVQNGRLVYNFEGYIPEPLSNELIRSQINKKCLLTPYVGSIGNIAIFPGDFKAHLGSNVGKIEIIQNLVIEEYVMYFFRSYAGYNELTKYKKATAQESISIEAIRNAFIPIPPLVEQKRIVEKIEELIPMINSMSK